MSLKKIFPAGIEVGDGVACAASPFCTFFILDYYDGPTEGFARIAGTKFLVYFAKIWWDDLQDNRVFEALIILDDDLRVLNEDFLIYIEKNLAANSSERSNGESAAASLIDPRQLLAHSPAVIRVHIFCENIAGELFVLPMR